jgi:hypothetical protein
MAAAILAGNGAFSGLVVVSRLIQASANSTATVTAVLLGSGAFAASLTANGTQTANLFNVVPGIAGLTAQGQVSAALVSAIGIVSQLSGTGTHEANAKLLSRLESVTMAQGASQALLSLASLMTGDFTAGATVDAGIGGNKALQAFAEAFGVQESSVVVSRLLAAMQDGTATHSLLLKLVTTLSSGAQNGAQTHAVLQIAYMLVLSGQSNATADVGAVVARLPNWCRSSMP